MASEAVRNEMVPPLRRELDYEAELIRQAKARSREAWTEIYERTHPKIFRYVLARVGDRATAEDLTATVFLEALKGVRSYTSRGRPLLAWLYAIARNVVNYHHRTLFRRRQEHPQGAALPVDEGGEPGDPASIVEGWDLRQAITRLSDDQREVIILRYFVGLTTPEVARVVGKRERAVYSLQTRAIKALRRHLR